MAIALTALGGSIGVATPSATAASTYILMPRAELLSLPVSGTAWSGLKAVADAPLSTPDLCNQDSKHHLQTLAAALVYARTGIASYGAKARTAILAALPTQIVGCYNATLSLGRQLSAYVLAANLAELSGTQDATFRSWLSAIRTKVIGGHPTWDSLVTTNRKSPQNWGAFAGASRIAADIYLGDAADLAAAANITRGFLGDRSAYSDFTTNLTSAAISWSCTGSVTAYTPENPGCTKNGVNLDGGVAADISRGGSLRWPPADPGIPYQLEAIQGVGLQVELLYRNGAPDAWSWSNSALKRAAAVVTRSGAAGGTGWNATTASRQMPWLLNRRYGTAIPTRTSGMGRAIGFTDWLYGSGGTQVAQQPAPRPTPTPTPTPATASGTAPVVTAPSIGLAATTVPTSGVPALVRWSLARAASGIRRYELQVNVDNTAWASVSLATATSASRWVVLRPGHGYAYRVRAVDLAGRVGVWRSVGQNRAAIVGDGSSVIAYRGAWGSAAYASYLGGRAHWTRTAGATATYRFSGASVSVIGPRGPGRGRSAVYLDGRYVATIDQLASSFGPRRVLFVRNIVAGSHTIVVKALGTAGRPMVAIDAFETRSAG